MKLQDQVCTLEQAKKLKELGITQECSHLHWIEDKCIKTHLATASSGAGMLCYYADGSRGIEVLMPGGSSESFSTFTVAELGVMLPNNTNSQKSDEGDYWTLSLSSHWTWNISDFKWKEWGTEAEARAELLIYMLETGKITAEEVNKRLTPTP